jgi:glutamyl-tRNA synthetase
MTMTSNVRTRFAPSPTGYLHVGGVRTALFCWLYARRFGGQFILRIEDTDRERSTQAAVETILEGMAWLELDHDEGPFYQTQRMDHYGRYIERLLDEDKAYHCYCSREELDEMRAAQRARGETPRYDGRCRDRSSPKPDVKPVVRFKNPLDGEVLVNDLVLGPTVFANTQLDDLIIARPDGTPTYNFTVVVDDLEMEISHVIRGNDHLNNTPRQINIFKALDAPLPEFAHLPMINGGDGKKLSKRHGAVSVTQYRDAGYINDALVNYLVRLGWSHGDQEIFSRDEMIQAFDITDVNKAAAVFDTEKLGWLNQHYIKEAPVEFLAQDLVQRLKQRGINTGSGADPQLMAEVQRERGKTLQELADKSLFAYEDFEEYEPVAAKKHLRPVALEAMERILAVLEELPDWTAETLDTAVRETVEALDIKLGKLAQPLRVALTGSAASPSIDQTLFLTGRQRSLERIRKAIEFLHKRAARP